MFSSCARTSTLESHAHLLPPEHADGFGPRRWSVLLNQTAVMTSSTYLAHALGNITDAQIDAMRAAVAPLVQRITFDEARPAGALGEVDAAEDLVQAVLQRRHGGKARELPSGYVQFFPNESWWNTTKGTSDGWQ
eukprot:727498-Prymnesium_polylepis.1